MDTARAVSYTHLDVYKRQPQEGPWVDAIDGYPLRGREGMRIDLAAWGWRVFVR